MIICGTGVSKGIGKEVSEDSFYADTDKGIFIVADGMYGDRLGKTASQTAVDTIASSLGILTAFTSVGRYEENVVHDYINKAFEEANEKILKMKALGTTISLAYAWGDKVFIAHAGDSRAYLLRDGNIEQLTEDHSLVASSVKLGVITEEQARESRHKDILTRALGRMNHHPDIKTLQWQRGDCFLLATDGLTEVLNNTGIGDIIFSNKDLQTACDKLVEVAKLKGAEDDITVVVFRID